MTVGLGVFGASQTTDSVGQFLDLDRARRRGLGRASSSFTNAFFVAGVILVIGTVCFVFVLGKIEPIPDSPPRANAPVPAV
jgi:hypothetical protein